MVIFIFLKVDILLIDYWKIFSLPASRTGVCWSSIWKNGSQNSNVKIIWEKKNTWQEKYYDIRKTKRNLKQTLVHIMRMDCCTLITNLFNMYLPEKSMPLLFTTAGGEEVGRVSLNKEIELLGQGGAWKRRGQNSFWSFGYAITAPSKSFRTGYLLNN